MARAKRKRRKPIRRRDQPISGSRAIPQPQTTRRPILLRDPRFQMPQSFFEPLPESMLADFEGGA
jgi:hypothetical protein